MPMLRKWQQDLVSIDQTFPPIDAIHENHVPSDLIVIVILYQGNIHSAPQVGYAGDHRNPELGRQKRSICSAGSWADIENQPKITRQEKLKPKRDKSWLKVGTTPHTS